jgi:hypothetical protein
VIENLPLSAAPGTSANACDWPASTSVTERSPTAVPTGSFSGRVGFGGVSVSPVGASLTSRTVIVKARTIWPAGVP